MDSSRTRFGGGNARKEGVPLWVDCGDLVRTVDGGFEGVDVGLLQEVEVRAGGSGCKDLSRVPVHDVSGFPGVDGRCGGHLPVGVVEGVVVVAGLVLLDALEDRAFRLANVEGRAVAARDLVDDVGRAIRRRRGLRAGERVPEGGRGGEGNGNVVAVEDSLDAGGEGRMVGEGNAMKEFPRRTRKGRGRTAKFGEDGGHQRRGVMGRKSVRQADVVDGVQFLVEVLGRADGEGTAGEGVDNGVPRGNRSGGVVLDVEVGVGRLPVDRGRKVRMEEDVQVGKKASLGVLDGVLEVGGKGVEVEVEGVSVRGVPGSSDPVVDEVMVEVEGVVEGIQGQLLYLSSAYLREDDGQRGSHGSSRGLPVELMVELEVGVIKAKVQEGADGSRS